MLCGSAMRQDGRSASLSAPNGPSQSALLYDAAGHHAVDAHGLHGTGTLLGDPIETLRWTLRVPGRRCGSLRSNTPASHQLQPSTHLAICFRALTRPGKKMCTLLPLFFLAHLLEPMNKECAPGRKIPSSANALLLYRITCVLIFITALPLLCVLSLILKRPYATHCSGPRLGWAR